MREIKFRGVATVNDKYNGIKVGDFVHGSFVSTNIDCQILFGDGEQISVDRMTVCQFTGLKDKNGVEIYEGDFVVYISTNMKRLPEEVTYNTQRGFYPIQEPVDYDEVYALGGDWEVIGNIYQNPELLDNA